MTSVRPLRALAIALFVATLAGALPAASAGPQPAAAWGPSVRVLTGTFRDVSAAIDGNGAAHVVAVGDTGVWYATNRTRMWVAKRILEHRSVSRFDHASLALDDADRLHIALSEASESEFGDVPGRIWYVTDRGRARGSFSAPRAITPSSSTDPTLKVRGAHTYLAWTGDVCVDYCEGAFSRVWYQTDGPDGWIRRRLPYDASWPDLRVDSGGKPRMVYTARGSTKDRLIYARGSLRTGSFSTEVVVRQPGWIVPRLVLDSQDRPLVAWTLEPFDDGPTKVFFGRRGAGGVWATREVGNGSVVAISVDTANLAHLAIGGDTGLREVVMKPSPVTATIDATAEVLDVDLRVPGTGRALAAYAKAAPDPGVYIARR